MDELRIEQRGPARWLTLNRPERRNALSRTLIRSLHGAVTSASNYPEARCIVLAGSGPMARVSASSRPATSPPP